VNDLLRMLERRVTLLSVLRSALGESAVFLRIGHENEEPELQSASLVAANYGLAHRTLGTVSVIGPVRMDYPQAIHSVRLAAKALSRFVEEVYQ
jgi:heat-inducible transcriptional repressor